jgi:hypothetical protein
MGLMFRKAFAGPLLVILVAMAQQHVFAQDEARKTTIAVIGDWPYNQVLLDNAPLLIDSINGDPEVSLVLHLGDIHSGSTPCTSAGIFPPIAGSDPGWNRLVFSLFEKFRAPFVFTPGDNEWTDCHKTKQAKSGDPMKELLALRSLFFARPGFTLGVNARQTLTQARDYDRNFPADAEFVENLMWRDANTVFVTLDVPGSNNDGAPWTNGFENPSAQAAARDHRTDADLRWMQAAFRWAAETNSAAVVIGMQADMWNPVAVRPDGDGLDGYTRLVQELARQSLAFSKPVLLLDGDSHIYGFDRPLADPASTTGLIHKTPAVPNLTRITVQGSTIAPAEWLRLTIDPDAPAVFSWKNVIYCKDPSTTCH